MKKLLLLNCIQDQNAFQQFNKIFLPKICKISKVNATVMNLNSLAQTIDFSSYSHLLITGSELSAAEKNPHDYELYSVISHFTKNDKAIYGICYGHQMVAKFLQDESVCKKATIPEFGWIKMKIVDNPFWKDCSTSIFFSSHYDELVNLNKSFHILATSPDCSIQAYQYESYPIFGTQFHPEFDAINGEESLQKHFGFKPSEMRFYKDDGVNSQNHQQTYKLFKNFLSY